MNNNGLFCSHSDLIVNTQAAVRFHFPRQLLRDPHCNSRAGLAPVQQSAGCLVPKRERERNNERDFFKGKDRIDRKEKEV